MKKNLLGILCLLLTILIASCQKTTSEKLPLSKDLKVISVKFGFSDFPSLEHGMLNFRDANHFDKYINFLGQAMDNIDPNDSTKDENDVLLEIEDGLGFTSIRNISHTAFMKQNEIGWPTIEEIPDEHFINSLDFKSVLNNDLEVRIGDEIIHYINKDYLVSVDATHRDILEKFRGLSISAPIEDIRNVDMGQQFSSIQMLTGEGYLWLKKKPTPNPLGEWNIFQPYYGFQDPCNSPYKATFKNIALHWNYEPAQEADFLVDFGDGSAPVMKHSPASSEVPAFTHIYPGPGTYNITIKGYHPGSTSIVVKQRVDAITVGDGGCNEVVKNSGWHYLIIGNRAVSGSIHMQYTGGIFGGTFNKRFIAETRSMEYKNDNWKLAKGKIGLYAQCAAKDKFCSQLDFLEASDSKNNSKEMLEHRTFNGRFYWNTAKSEHYLTINGTKYTLKITMNSCD